MSDTFSIRRGDTLPVFEVQLAHNGVPYDATGGTGYLWIRLVGGTILRRTMTPEIIASGIFQYQWLASDWAEPTIGSGTAAAPYLDGGLVESPFPLEEVGPQHTMDYEVVGPTTIRVTFPDDDVDDDVFHVSPDKGDA